MNELQILLKALEVANKAGAFTLQDSVNVVTSYNAVFKTIEDLTNKVKELEDKLKGLETE